MVNLFMSQSRKRRRNKAPNLPSDEYDGGLGEYQTKVAVGREYTFLTDVAKGLAEAALNGQNFICIPLFHPRKRKTADEMSTNNNDMITRSDLAIDGEDWIAHVIGKSSPWIDVGNTDKVIRMKSEAALLQEYLYACHLGLQTFIMPLPIHRCVGGSIHVDPNVSRCLQLLSNVHVVSAPPQIWVRIPFVETPLSSLLSAPEEYADGWLVWNEIRNQTGHNPRLFIAIDLSTLRVLPSTKNEETSVLRSLRKWGAEPIKAVIVSTSCFQVVVRKVVAAEDTHEERTSLILPNIFKEILTFFFKFNIHVIISGRPADNISFHRYVTCIERLCDRKYNMQQPSLYDQFCCSYRDNLQSPLHPLSDNLDSETYRIMEKDPVKYSQYERALAAAMHDLKKPTMSEGSRDKYSSSKGYTQMIMQENPLTVLVVGAGRGPLVQAALNAAILSNVDVQIWAVEKNFNAVVTLRNRFKQQQQQQQSPSVEGLTNTVTVLFCDMRDLRSKCPDLSVDIIVSELLGSWGDNEASPECLHAMESGGFLKSGGVMIPQSYCSYAAPVSCSALWMQARDMPQAPTLAGRPISTPSSGLDSPYVVNMHSYCLLSSAKPLFQFEHPNLTTEKVGLSELFSRQEELRFTVDVDDTAIVHGFAGYFTCVLYKDIVLSTEPSTHSPGMFSWFPMFIPLAIPLVVRKSDEVALCIWRIVRADRMWYEWCLTLPTTTAIQNSNGNTFNVRL